MASIPVPRGHPAIKLLNDRATDCDGFITHLDRSPNGLPGAILVQHGPWRIAGMARDKGFLAIFHALLHILWRFRHEAKYHNELDLDAINLAIDLLLYELVWPGVRKFVTGHLWLRLRKPTGWRRALLNGLPPENFIDNPPKFYTGPLIDYWVLEYGAVGDAYSLVAKGEVDIKTWDLSVWSREGGEWEVWEIWRLHDQEAMGALLERESHDIVCHFRKNQVYGKEDLIEQWTSMRTSGAPATIQSTNAVVDLFHSHGINFEELWTNTVREVLPRAAAPKHNYLRANARV
ncbi:hypothetical protein BD779DRAFT_1785309 [Infundibulicybe gibba]|nr:hypothetical protein BD779DRAFT_1785309 [Infundibulicybe gibba]